ncbi:MAG: hypothetical protein EZS28_022277 [Streblomastix strix]|uniref:Uncharacterized protein n=1 Tax=Streblomastix strix TaxID=222440 RepID=A0A5J4VIG9_9EUKA|nr:MAG: hypothetical protein EZS28_022277 [Streblomastix strix]
MQEPQSDLESLKQLAKIIEEDSPEKDIAINAAILLSPETSSPAENVPMSPSLKDAIQEIMEQKENEEDDEDEELQSIAAARRPSVVTPSIQRQQITSPNAHSVSPHQRTFLKNSRSSTTFLSSQKL